MKVLVLGANGATGFNVVTQLLKQGIGVKALTRNVGKFDLIKSTEHIEVIKGSILELDHQILKHYLSDVDAVVSCLGHNITLKGIFEKPYTLVVDALIKTINSIKEINKNKTVKIVLMNTTACINKSQNEKFKITENIVMKMMRFLLPPQRDNDLALRHLIETVGISNQLIEWIAVRPDTLINEAEVSEYTIHPSPVRSPIFDAGKTSRINVANFMVSLLKDEDLWEKWKYKTPVIYNREAKKQKKT
ncbi:MULTISPECIES: NAD(P)-binding oxidoreductase [unclassified Lentimicrobium]|uniref:NAD(P)-binding oxidoreductase n=1 Tax=unclassified Lentimicrobium TaxID=2677434 RepID=UPI00155673ED|nr:MULTISPECIES: NAD(P)-binding oxidoreductase [unclassified Lentimicrobium]NPD46643.1 SDR family oxidoreductase [Lentimicrobium sp. S6]NPD84768.1 SDR family oxidoreductase [Lentimicrobium sp. L6]